MWLQADLNQSQYTELLNQINLLLSNLTITKITKMPFLILLRKGNEFEKPYRAAFSPNTFEAMAEFAPSMYQIETSVMEHPPRLEEKGWSFLFGDIESFSIIKESLS